MGMGMAQLCSWFRTPTSSPYSTLLGSLFVTLVPLMTSTYMNKDSDEILEAEGLDLLEFQITRKASRKMKSRHRTNVNANATHMSCFPQLVIF
jgi:hypothetical protein